MHVHIIITWHYIFKNAVFLQQQGQSFIRRYSAEGSAVLGLRKFGACSAVSVGRLTLVEGGLVWRLVAGTWAFVVTFFRRLMRMYTPKDTRATVRIANTTTRPKQWPENKKAMFPIKKMTKRNIMWPIWVNTNFALLLNNLLFHNLWTQTTSITMHNRSSSMLAISTGTRM